MKFLIFIVSLLLISSCSHIYFEEVQPKGGVRQSEMPEELYGYWFGESEGWELSENGITNIDFETDSLGNVLDTTYQTTPLSYSLRIYKAKEFYLIHTRENSPYWEIITLKLMKNGDLNIYHSIDPKIFASVKGLKLEYANYDIDEESQNVNKLDPEHNESIIFNHALFSGQMKVRQLRKIVKSIPPDTLRKNDFFYHELSDSK